MQKCQVGELKSTVITATEIVITSLQLQFVIFSGGPVTDKI